MLPPLRATDTSTFAYRMMQKMGWKEGKGLGKNESGTASNIRVQRRPEMLGACACDCRRPCAARSAAARPPVHHLTTPAPPFLRACVSQPTGLGASRDEQGNGTLSQGLKEYDSILSSLAEQFGTTPKKEKGKKKRKHRHKYVAEATDGVH